MAKRTGKYYIGLAEQGGCRVEFGKGDHVKMYPPNGGRPMICPVNLKGNGTEYAIVKWLKAVGVLATVLAILFWILI